MSAARQMVVRGLVADVAEGRLRHGDPLPAPVDLAHVAMTAHHDTVESDLREYAGVASGGPDAR